MKPMESNRPGSSMCQCAAPWCQRRWLWPYVGQKFYIASPLLSNSLHNSKIEMIIDQCAIRSLNKNCICIISELLKKIWHCKSRLVYAVAVSCPWWFLIGLLTSSFAITEKCPAGGSFVHSVKNNTIDTDAFVRNESRMNAHVHLLIH